MPGLLQTKGYARFNQPEDGRCRHEEKLPFGATVKLPEPVNITLDTEPLKEFVD